MLEQAFEWFLTTHSQVLRRGDKRGFEILMLMSVAHVFGLYTPKELADYLDIGFQSFYARLKSLSLYSVQKLMLGFMVKQAAQKLNEVLQKSDATQSRAKISIHGDDSVLERVGKQIRCTYSWYSGRFKQVMNGNDLLGLVLTLNGEILPLHLMFASKQGRANTTKPELLMKMMTELKELFAQEGIDITAFPLTLDSWFASEELKQQLWSLGFENVVMAGKSSYVYEIEGEKKKAKDWKSQIDLKEPQWGVDVPHFRAKAQSPTFGKVVLFFFAKSSTRVFYLIDFSRKPGRSAEIWNIWQEHHRIEQFWRLLKSVFRLKTIQLRDDGLYAGLLIKVIAYLMVGRLLFQKAFKNLSVVQLLRKIRREYSLNDFIEQHFHGLLGGT
jgi:hypothetical protein